MLVVIWLLMKRSPHRPGNVRTRDDGAALRDRRLRLVQGGDLPAAGAPFVDVGLLLAQGRVAAVAWVEPGVVGQDVKDPRRDVVDQRLEVRR